MEGVIFNIQRYSVHDGPGIRTIVFLKGCPLRCWWCANPESQQLQPQIAFNAEKCIGKQCLLCLKVCSHQAIGSASEDKTVTIDFDCCHNCLQCAQRCPAKAINVYGYQQSMTDILDQIEEESAFYSRSGGGLTLSGGEPTLQGDFALALLKEAKKRRIHTAIETCGYAPWETIKAIINDVDYVLYDIKSMDEQKHQHFTGVSNQLIIDNLKRLKQTYPDKPFLVRTPVIPGFNDQPEDIRAIHDLVQSMPKTSHELLKYHRFGQQKYDYMGRAYPLGEIFLEDAKFEQLKQLIQQ